MNLFLKRSNSRLDQETIENTGRQKYTIFDRRDVWLLVLCVLILRILYLMISPYELVADESHYWEWSRRPALSYYTKGPGVAWTIAASTHLFGDDTWAIRLPSVICGGITMLSLAAIGIACSGVRRVGFMCALLFLLVPVYFGASQFMTIDSPFLTCWALAMWVGWYVLQPGDQVRGRTTAWIGLAAFLGVGFLYKYTILLLVPGLLLYGIPGLRRCRWEFRRCVYPVLFSIVFLLCISPVLLWNVRYGWPTLSHLLGHLHMSGGDISPRSSWSYDPMWTVEMLLGQVGVLGPPMLVLMVLSVISVRRKRTSQPQQWDAAWYLICCGLPVIVFYFLVSFVTDVEANWPIAGYLGLLVVVAMAFSDEWRRYRLLVGQWLSSRDRPRPRAGFFRRRPETGWQMAWHWTIGWGVAAGLIIMLAPLLRYLPGMEQMRGLKRVTGHHVRADRVQDAITAIESRTGRPPMIIADQYTNASLLAYYLPDRPTRVFSAASLLGGRVSSYDFFEDTDLTSPSLTGRDAVLSGTQLERWQSVLRFDNYVEFDSADQLYFGIGYGGVRRDSD